MLPHAKKVLYQLNNKKCTRYTSDLWRDQKSEKTSKNIHISVVHLR